MPRSPNKKSKQGRKFSKRTKQIKKEMKHLEALLGGRSYLKCLSDKRLSKTYRGQLNDKEIRLYELAKRKKSRCKKKTKAYKQSKTCQSFRRNARKRLRRKHKDDKSKVDAALKRSYSCTFKNYQKYRKKKQKEDLLLKKLRERRQERREWHAKELEKILLKHTSNKKTDSTDDELKQTSEITDLTSEMTDLTSEMTDLTDDSSDDDSTNKKKSFTQKKKDEIKKILEKEDEWLSSDIIDRVSEILNKQRNRDYNYMLFSQHNILKQESHQSKEKVKSKVLFNSAGQPYKKIFVPWNVSETHWLLFEINTQNKTVTWFDSMDNKVANGNRAEKLLEQLALQNKNYKIQAPAKPTPQQKDQTSCGIFVIMNMYRRALNRPLITAKEIGDSTKIRQGIQKVINDKSTDWLETQYQNYLTTKLSQKESLKKFSDMLKDKNKNVFIPIFNITKKYWWFLEVDTSAKTITWVDFMQRNKEDEAENIGWANGVKSQLESQNQNLKFKILAQDKETPRLHDKSSSAIFVMVNMYLRAMGKSLKVDEKSGPELAIALNRVLETNSLKFLKEALGL